jgi:threonine synthase
MPVSGYRCVRCGARYPADRDYFGCPACETEVPANLEMDYAAPPPCPKADWEGRRPGLWRYVEALPVDGRGWVGLGEGGTPLLECRRLGDEIGLPGLMAKNEAQNPTWSFKDRLASVAVAWARANGRAGIAVSSSGNAGAAAAAYAARAGLPCLVLTTRAFPGTMQRFMRSFGAMVVALPTAPDRWTLNRALAQAWGWLPMSNAIDPPVGGHPAGVEGCKTIAYEIAQDLGWRVPDAVLVPVAYGDALYGIYRGFRDLVAAGVVDRLPRLVAVEAYPSLTRALSRGTDGPVTVEASGSRAHSIATPRGTYQALRAVRESGGTAVRVGDAEALQAQRALREREGLLVELSAAVPLAAARALAASGALRPEDRVVMVITSSGLKDLEVTDPDDEIPLAEPTLGGLARVLEERYGYAA